MLNIGPCGNVTMGEPSFISAEFERAKKADPDVELVTTSGHGKNGALCVLQQSIRPQVESSLHFLIFSSLTVLFIFYHDKYPIDLFE